MQKVNQLSTFFSFSSLFFFLLPPKESSCKNLVLLSLHIPCFKQTRKQQREDFMAERSVDLSADIQIELGVDFLLIWGIVNL